MGREVGVATQNGADPFIQKAWGVDTFRLGLASKSQQEPMEKVFSQLPSDSWTGHTMQKSQQLQRGVTAVEYSRFGGPAAPLTQPPVLLILWCPPCHGSGAGQGHRHNGQRWSLAH